MKYSRYETVIEKEGKRTVRERGGEMERNRSGGDKGIWDGAGAGGGGEWGREALIGLLTRKIFSWRNQINPAYDI